jgi:hypothetical protein
MWMLSFVPDAWLHLAVLGVLGVGAVIYILSYFTGFIPTLMPAREPVRIAGTALIMAGVYFYGSYATEMAWRQRVEAVEAKVTTAEKQSQSANTALVAARRKKTQILVQRQVVIQEHIKTVEKQIDSECRVDAAATQILNDAAKNPWNDAK